MKLIVETKERRVKLEPGDEITFGRDSSCTVCLGTGDPGISRIAGQIAYSGGYWTVTNLSRKRPLHVVDEIGFAVPLPVALDGAESRRAIDRPRMTVLIVGDSFTHALRLTTDALPAPGGSPASPADRLSTRTQRPRLTDRRREVVVAMAAGYLKPFPDYDPRPRTYQAVADLLGLNKTQVVKRVEDVREELVAAGVPNLHNELDSRQTLCEWLLAMRLIGPADLDWLQTRVDAASARHVTVGTPVGPDPNLPSTDHPIVDEITTIAERTAHQVAGPLLARLRQYYGENWLTGINARRPSHAQARRQHLRDYRLCLSILAADPATQGWIQDDCRCSARELNRIANMAAHRRTLTPADLTLARGHARVIMNGVPPR